MLMKHTAKIHWVECGSRRMETHLADSFWSVVQFSLRLSNLMSQSFLQYTKWLGLWISQYVSSLAEKWLYNTSISNVFPVKKHVYNRVSRKWKMFDLPLMLTNAICTLYYIYCENSHRIGISEQSCTFAL